MDEVTVCYSVNASFFQHLYVSAASLKAHARCRHQVYVLYDDALQEDLSRLMELSGPEFTINPIKINPDTLSNIKTHGRFNISHFYRLFIPYLLPENQSRALYLDADIVITGPLDELFRIDLEGKPLAAAKNADYTETEILGIPQDAPYFNSGVMLMDMKLWKKEDITQKVIQFAEQNPEKLAFVDQCALNAELYQRWKILSPVWNFQEVYSWMTKSEFDKHIDACPVPDARKEPHVIHFTGPEKPWHYKSNHPWKPEYWKYLKNSPYRDYIPPDKTFTNRVKKFLYHRMPAVHRFLHRIKKTASSD